MPSRGWLISGIGHAKWQMTARLTTPHRCGFPVICCKLSGLSCPGTALALAVDASLTILKLDLRNTSRSLATREKIDGMCICREGPAERSFRVLHERSLPALRCCCWQSRYEGLVGHIYPSLEQPAFGQNIVRTFVFSYRCE